MLELENVCDSALESNRDSAISWLGRLFTCYCKDTGRTNRLSAWAVKLI